MNGYENDSIWGELIWTTESTSNTRQMGLRLAEALLSARPDDREFRVLHAAALYRVGRYAEALSLLEPWQRERERAIVSQIGQFFMSGLPVELLEEHRAESYVMRAIAFLAMTNHRLGNRNQAYAALTHLRILGEYLPPKGKRGQRYSHNQGYLNLLREAETLIEGKPRPGK